MILPVLMQIIGPATERKVKRIPDRKKALVVNPPLEIESVFIDYPEYVNLGAVQTAAALRARGFAVDVADAFAQPGSDVLRVEDGRIRMGCEGRALLEPRARGGYDAVVLCLSVFHRPFSRHEFTAAFADLARGMFPDALLVAADAYFGGMHYVDYEPEAFFSNYPRFDALVRYESETALPEVLRTAPRGVRTAAEGRGQGVALEDLPLPAWDLIDMECYFQFLDKFYAATGRVKDHPPQGRRLPLATSRGCLYGCAFCAPPVSRGISPYRSFSGDYLARYLGALKQEYAIQGVAVLDGIANAHPKPFEDFLDNLERLGLEAAFVNGLRADRLSEAHIKKLAALCPGLAVSAESACERVRNGILGKRLDLAAVEQVAAWCRQNSLPLQIHYMIGVPGETMAEANQTLAHAASMARAHGAEPLLQFCVPAPGTPLHEQCTRSGIPAPDFQGPYFHLFQNTPAVDTPALPAAAQRALAERLKMRLCENHPDKLIINLTYRCNNKCVMCAVGGRPARDMPGKQALELLREYRLRGVRLADFDGGEPTLHPDLLPIIHAARRMGYERVNVTTNGRKMADRGYASRLLLCGLTELHISLYGASAQTHEKTTGVKGSFEQTVQGIRHALELKPGRISFGINTVVTADNYTQLGELMDFVADLGALTLSVQYPTPFGRGASRHLPPYEKTSRLLARAVREHAGRVAVQVVNLPPCRLPGAQDSAVADAGKYGRVMAFVNAPPQNLGAYLSEKRARISACAACPYFIVCEGEYVFESVPDPGTRGR